MEGPRLTDVTPGMRFISTIDGRFGHLMLIASWEARGLGCSPIKAVRELVQTVRSSSVAGLRVSVPERTGWTIPLVYRYC